MRKLFLGIACWNTVVVLIQIFILPKFASWAAELVTEVSPVTIALPIVIPLFIWAAITFKKQILWLIDGIVKAEAMQMGLE